ncbi:Anaerobic ribonucleoside-triphosphate reductase [Acanthopleuribacter pedis]
MVSVGNKQPNNSRGASSLHLDQLTESELQSSIFRSMDHQPQTLDFNRLRETLQKDSQIPGEVIQKVIHRVQANAHHLGLEQTPPSLVLHWVTGLLRQEGFPVGAIPLQSLELSLSDVELNIYHPVGYGAGADQNPEATSQRIAQRIKAQFACRRIYQQDVVQAHDEGRLELLHLGAIDRPHHVFLTPDYLKHEGLPVMRSAPSAGPAKHADVLLAHLIRFTHELQNHFAGDIHWGHVNTLLLPFLEPMNEAELDQFAQQMLYEFGQLDLERGGLYRQVILDFDLDLPKTLVSTLAVGPGGEKMGRSYGDYGRTLVRFNEVLLNALANGDARGNPWHSPQIVFHLNERNAPWDHLHQKLVEVAFRHGNPRIAFSDSRRDCGAMGYFNLNDSDYLKAMQHPAQMRGFSLSSLAVNLPTMALGRDEQGFWQEVERIFNVSVTAHRQKRLFISRLMAYGNRGPLQFLRHRLGNQPFLKIDQATQPMQLIGLGEAAAALNGSPSSSAEAITNTAIKILTAIEGDIGVRNRIHKMRMLLSCTKNDNVAYRFAYLDFKRHAKDAGAYLIHEPDQSHPIYTEGPNILPFKAIGWRERFRHEGKLHRFFSGLHNTVLFLHGGTGNDAGLLQRLLGEARNAGISQLQPAPDLTVCMSCHSVFATTSENENCPSCGSAMVSPYGYCQAGYSPVSTWCLGKRSEWRIRHRLDHYHVPVQQDLPW